MENRVEKVIKNLKKNNMNGYLVKDEKELIDKIEEIVADGATVSVGGSMTLFETGIIDYLRQGRYKFLDRYKDGLSREEVGKIYREAFFADAYFTSTNAITEEGQLYNVDGNGNRVAAMIFGPKKVIVITGTNKIVADMDEAIKRVREVAAPLNSKRLDRMTPCVKTEKCMSCSSKDRICNDYTVIGRQGDNQRLHVIFLDKKLGY